MDQQLMTTEFTGRRGVARRREAGVAMLVVMLLLTVGTTLASMTAHTITLEMRSSGYYRQQAQTHYVAESAMQGVLGMPLEDIRLGINAAGATPMVAEGFPANIADNSLMQNYGEPDPIRVTGGGRPVFRMPQEQVDASLIGNGGAPPVLDGQSLGATPFVPWYVVDFTDFTDEEAPLAGMDASGNSQFKYINATVTVRGRTLLGAAGVANADRGASLTVAGNQYQQFTDAAYDMRAVVRLGPVPR